MTTKEAIKAVEKSGTRISKEKLLEAIRKSSARDFAYGTDGDQALCLVRLPI
jgi:hypothetical protein